jgi:flagellar basal-body rod protein FlgC
MGLFDGLDISATGLSAERLRMDVTAENLANARTTRGADGNPYRRKQVVLQQASESFGSTLAGALQSTASVVNGGVKVAGIAEDQTAGHRVYDPGHPDADANGYVTLPNVNPVTEMVDLITASRGYEANVTAMQSAKQIFAKTLEILR